MKKLVMKTCPTCGTRRLRRVKRDIKSHRGGQPYVARGIEVEECANCGERLFSPEALEAIAEQQPQSKRARARKSA